MIQPLSGENLSEELRTAVRRFESGLCEQAGQLCLSILDHNPHDAWALYLLRLVERRLARPKPSTKPALIWQFDPARAWESDWLQTLLGDVVEKSIVDNSWSQIAETMIVVDNRLVPEKVSYYRRAFEMGCRVILVHLSDEAFKDDLGAYQYCDGVIRNYRSDLLAGYSKIRFIPLGYKAGFTADAGAAKPAAARKYLWSFAGDAKKLTRGPMLQSMARAGDGFQHLSEGFGSRDALPTDAYRRLMDDSIVVPCPSGWSNLETFRVYEALEAGCIPIVEKRPGFDYFTQLLGPHPMPTVTHWEDAATLVMRLKAEDGLEPLRQACAAWWATYKPALTAEVGAFITDRLKAN
ncbi:MAG: glycosyltransferase family 47 protein [Rhodospirillaceae bacterium]|nr:glycosyltransferase family 47 protein [Rhodospirillaceae bacterium]